MTSPSSDASRPLGYATHVLPAVLYTAAIFYGGSLAGMSGPRIAHGDKVAHLLGFALLQLLAFRAVRFALPRLGLRAHAVLGAVISSLAGAGLEVFQARLPYRSAEVLDWVADTVGAVLAAALVVLVLRRGEGGDADAIGAGLTEDRASRPAEG